MSSPIISEEVLQQAVAAKLAEMSSSKPAEAARDIELDAYEKLFVDNLMYRELAARRAQELASRDLEDCVQLRREFLQKLGQKHKVKDGWAVSVDFQKKTAKTVSSK